MQRFRALPIFLLALLLSITALSARAQFGVRFHVRFAPPALVMYEQPICPEPNLLWTPGYWAYDNYSDYYWVPGAWVPAPYYGALWTPPYWDWYGGGYRFHGGYWGEHVGYYGGIDYGYGYGGIGFAGGEWRGNDFAYNTAVMHVNQSYVHNTYNNETIVRQNTIQNNNHVSYNGGNGGISRRASAGELAVNRERHTSPTTYQNQHISAARVDKTSFAKANGGHPTRTVEAKPLAMQRTAAPAGMKMPARNENKVAPQNGARLGNQPEVKSVGRPENKATPSTQVHPGTKMSPNTQTQPRGIAAPQRENPARTTVTPQQQHTAPAQQRVTPVQQQHAAPAQQQRAAPAQQQRTAPAQQHANKEEPKK